VGCDDLPWEGSNPSDQSLTDLRALV